MAFFTELEKEKKNIVWKHKTPQTTKAITREKNEVRRIRLPDFRLYYSHQNSMVQKQNYTSVKQDRKLRNNSHAPVITLFDH